MKMMMMTVATMTTHDTNAACNHAHAHHPCDLTTTTQLVSPRLVVAQLLATLSHRNWRVRQEVIILVTQVKFLLL